jgi:uncharacterized membrane protein
VFIPVTRILTITMFAAVCFGLIVPMALQRHNTGLAIGISVLFVIYLVLQAVVWRRMKPRA